MQLARFPLNLSAVVYLAAILLTPACASQTDGDSEGVKINFPGGKADALGAPPVVLDLRGTLSVPSFRSFGLKDGADAAVGYFVDAAKDGTLLISLTKDGGSKPAAVLGVYGPVLAGETPWNTMVGQVTEPDRATGGSTISVKVPEEGTYFVLVTSSTSGFRSSIIRYGISITCEGTAPCKTVPATPHVEGTCFPGAFTLPEGTYASLTLDRCDVTTQGTVSVDRNLQVVAGVNVLAETLGADANPTPTEDAGTGEEDWDDFGNWDEEAPTPADRTNDNRAAIEVLGGILFVEGTESAPVTFRSAVEGVPWWGVSLDNAGIAANHLVIEDARAALLVDALTDPVITASSITYDPALEAVAPSVVGVSFDLGAANVPTITDSHIKGYATGVSVIGHLTVVRSFIEARKYGVLAESSETPGSNLKYNFNLTSSAVVSDQAGVWLRSSSAQAANATITNSVIRAGAREALHLESDSIASRGRANQCTELSASAGTAAVTQSDLISSLEAAFHVAGGRNNVVTVSKSNLVSGAGAAMELTASDDFATAGSNVTASNVYRGDDLSSHIAISLSRDKGELYLQDNYWGTYGEAVASTFGATVTKAECDTAPNFATDATMPRIAAVTDAGPVPTEVTGDVAAATWATNPVVAEVAVPVVPVP